MIPQDLPKLPPVTPIEIPYADGSKVFCPICVANGYSASTQATGKQWFLTGNSVGGAIWNSSIPRLQLGLGYHGSSRAVRGLVSYRAIEQVVPGVGLNLGYGFQSQESGATGASATLEHNMVRGAGVLNLFGGISVQENDRRGRFVGGFKWSPDGKWFVGNQYDGRAHNPFVQRAFGDYSLGLLYVSARSLSLTAGWSF